MDERMYRAIKNGDIESLKTLCKSDNKADCEFLNEQSGAFGNTMLMQAAEKGDKERFSILVNCPSVDLCVRNNHDETVMDICQRKLNEACEKYDFRATEEEKRQVFQEVQTRKSILYSLKLRVRAELVAFAEKNGQKMHENTYEQSNKATGDLPEYLAYNHEHGYFERSVY